MNDFSLKVQRANSLDFAVLFQQSNGTPIVVDGMSSVEFVAKAAAADTTPVVLKRNTLAGGDDTEVTPNSNGVVVHLQTTDTAAVGEYVCSLTLGKPSTGAAYTWSGTILVTERA
jgi:hypothetical protein